MSTQGNASTASTVTAPTTPALTPQQQLENLLGFPLPTIPTVDQLLKPINDAWSSFGTGYLANLNPSTILTDSTAFMNAALELATGATTVLDSEWSSNAGTNATETSKTAVASGDKVNAQATQISGLTTNATATVAAGNANLATIAESFVATAAAAAPVIWTPPGQAMIMAAAAEHISAALEVVQGTRASMTTQTAQMTEAGQKVETPAPVATNGTPTNAASSTRTPFTLVKSILTNVGKPLITTANAGSKVVLDFVPAANKSTTTDPSKTSADLSKATTTAPQLATTVQAGVSPTQNSSSLKSSDPSATTQKNLQPGTISQPGTTETHAASVANTHATTAAAPNVSSTGLGTGAGMMPMAGARAGNDEHRSNQSYFVDAVNRTDVVGDLGTVVSPVIGADISEENNGVTEA